MKKKLSERLFGTGNHNRRKSNQLMKRKLAGILVVVVLALFGLLIKIAYLSATKGEQYSKHVLAASQSHYSSESIAYKRGSILDRNGTVLATSEKRYNVIFDCLVVNSDKKGRYIEPSLRALHEVFGLDTEEMRTLLTDEKTCSSQYQVVKKKISVEEKKAYDEYMSGTADRPLSKEEAEDRRWVKGIWFEEQYVRTYPLGSLAGEVLGFTYDGTTADWGLEGYYCNTLNGVDGRKYGYWGADTQIEQTIVEPIDGYDIRTTIDVTIQGIVESVIEDFKDAYRVGPFSEDEAAKNIGVIVMDPNNGAILSMASDKGYDPNAPQDLTGYLSESQINALKDDTAKRTEKLQSIWRNFCVSDAYEPGSVVKPLTVASALECGTVTEWDSFDCDGYETVSGIRIKCSDLEGHGHESLSDTIRNSCNDALMQIGSKLGIENFCKYQSVFHFGTRTGVDISGEADGIIRTTETMGSVDLATASFGQGYTCTMLQEAAAICSVINGGYYYKPHFMSCVLDSNGVAVRSNEEVLMNQAVSSDTSELVKSFMKASVDSGTSKYSKIDGYSMGGKTGTAQKIPRGNGKYLVSYVGFVPYEDPQLVIYVVVDEPNVAEQADSRYAQWIAKEILTQVLPYLNIYPDEESNPANRYLTMTYRNPEGDTSYDLTADTNVPEPQGGTGSSAGSGNHLETDGYTNEEAGIEE